MRENRKKCSSGRCLEPEFNFKGLFFILRLSDIPVIKLSCRDGKGDAYQEFHSALKGIAIVRHNTGLLS